MLYTLHDGSTIDCVEVSSNPEVWSREVLNRVSHWWAVDVVRTPAMAFCLLFLSEATQGHYSTPTTSNGGFIGGLSEGLFRLRYSPEATVSDVWAGMLLSIASLTRVASSRIAGNALDVAASLGATFDACTGPEIARHVEGVTDNRTRELLRATFSRVPRRYVLETAPQVAMMRLGACFATPAQRLAARHNTDYGFARCYTCDERAYDCECEAPTPTSRLEKQEQRIDLLQDATWGIEVPHKRGRVSFPRSRGTRDIPRFVGVEIEITGTSNADGFYDFAERHGAGIKGDGSLPFGEESFEMVLPPRKGAQFDAMLDDLRNVFRASRTMVSEHCGLHVHVDARRLTEEHLVNVSRAWYMHEGAFLSKHVDPKRRGNRYCREWSRMLAGSVPDFSRVTFRNGYLSGLRVYEDRYVTLNACALSAHKTLEFRAFSWDDFPNEKIGGYRASIIDRTNADAAIAHIRSKASAAARFVRDAMNTTNPTEVSV